jgi:uncharacterized membrane protein required for colicin V production
MLDLILLVTLVAGFFIGLRRGLILQVVHLTGFIISFIVAYFNYEKLAAKLDLVVPYPQFSTSGQISMLLESFSLEKVYYNGIAFAGLFFGTKIALHILASMLDFLADLPLLNQINRSLGGVLGFIEIYLIVFFILYVGALLPIEAVQDHLTGSAIAGFIVEHTPIFSEQVKELWVEHMEHFNN